MTTLSKVIVSKDWTRKERDQIGLRIETEIVELRTNSTELSSKDIERIKNLTQMMDDVYSVDSRILEQNREKYDNYLA